MQVETQKVQPKKCSGKSKKNDPSFTNTMTKEQFNTFAECLVYQQDKTPIQTNCDKQLKDKTQKPKRNSQTDLKPEKKQINGQIEANSKEFFIQKEKAYFQTLEAINVSLVPYFINTIEEKRPQYEEKELYRYSPPKLQTLMTNMMEYIRVSNLEASLTNNSPIQEILPISHFIGNLNSPKKRDRKPLSRKFECHFKNCLKVYNSRGALSFHMRTKHDRQFHNIKEEFLNTNNPSGIRNSELEDPSSWNELQQKPNSQVDLTIDFVKNTNVRLESTDCDDAFEPNNGTDELNVCNFLENKQTCLQEDITNFFEYDCQENQIQRHPFFIGFEEDDIYRFEIPANEISYEEMEKFSMLENEASDEIDGFLTGGEEMETDSFKSLLGEY